MRRIAIEELNSSEKELSSLRELLGNGGIAAVPTESFYALAVNPWSETGVQRVLETKGRDSVKALPVLFASKKQLEDLGVLASPTTLEHFFQIWPAPLSVVLPIRQSLPASRGLASLAVRLPAESRLRQLLASVGPMTGTSANRSGSQPLDDPGVVEAIFHRDVDLLVDGGKTAGGKPSTIVDATCDPPAVLRSGAFPWPAAGNLFS